MKILSLIKQHNILIITILGLFFASCNSGDSDIRQMCADLHEQYPKATLQDVYKTCYQDCFGSAHLLSDTAAARHYLHQELESLQGVDLSAMPKEEPTGYRHRFIRVNLSCVLEGQLTEDQLLAQFIEASSPGYALELDWVKEWEKIERIALEVNPEWANPELQEQLRESARAQHTVTHSEPFREAYHPHYRIIKN